MMGHGMGACGGAAGALLGALAALGYWVMRNAEKDGGYVRWAGRVVGWVLLVVGLAGFLCASASHAFRRCGQGGLMKCHTGAMAPGSTMPGQGSEALPPGHPPIPKSR